MKHVKLLESLKDILSFQWGRESFFWTVSTMIPGKMIKGKCDDPNGDFCTKIRQKTKKMSGLPLALQLVAYEVIPQLLARLGGNDEVKLIDCDRLPQHKGLNLSDVLEAENNPEVKSCVVTFLTFCNIYTCTSVYCVHLYELAWVYVIDSPVIVVCFAANIAANDGDWTR